MQRSGTTALASVLNRAFREAGGCFTVNGRLPYAAKPWVTDGAIADGHLRVDEIIYSLRRRPFYFPEARAWLGRAETALYASARRVANLEVTVSAELELRRIMREAYGHVELWGDKYNEYLLDLDFLIALYPDAKWLFLYRDPWSVARSMGDWRGKPWNPTEQRACLEKWAVWNRHWLDFRDRVTADRRFELSYEALGEARSIGGLSDFLGFDLERHATSLSPIAPLERSDLPAGVAETWERLQSRE
jgi:hypothetical protein